jgi:hypothetical protein
MAAEKAAVFGAQMATLSLRPCTAFFTAMCRCFFCGHVPLPFPASSGKKPAVLEKQTPARPAGWQGSVCNPCLIGANARNLRGVCQFQVSSGGFATLGREFVRNALTFVQGIKTCTLNCGDVNEHIAAAVVGLDETKTFGGVEPFYDTGCHVDFPLLQTVAAVSP